MVKNLEKTIREYLSNVIHMSLATSYKNKPWVCEVHFVYDKDLNFYFRSKSDRRHSIEILKNKFVAGNIVEQHNPEMKPRGVYFEGTCKIIDNLTESDETFKLFNKRVGIDKTALMDAGLPNGHKFFKITTKRIYLFDGRESSPSRKYELLLK